MFATLSDSCVACMSTGACADCQMHEIMLCDKCAMQNCVGHFDGTFVDIERKCIQFVCVRIHIIFCFLSCL